MFVCFFNFVVVVVAVVAVVVSLFFRVLLQALQLQYNYCLPYTQMSRTEGTPGACTSARSDYVWSGDVAGGNSFDTSPAVQANGTR